MILLTARKILYFHGQSSVLSELYPETHLPLCPSAALDFLAADTAAPLKIRLAEEQISCEILAEYNPYIRLEDFMKNIAVILLIVLMSVSFAACGDSRKE